MQVSSSAATPFADGVAVNSLSLNPLTINSSAVSLVRQGTAGLSYKLHTQLNVSYSTLITNLAATGDLDSSGNGALALSASALNLFGFQLNGGSFSLIRSGSAISLSMAASMSFVGVAFGISTPTALTLQNGGPIGTVSVTVNGGARFAFDGWNIGGTLTLAVTHTAATFTVTGGSLTIVGLFSNLGVAGSLSSTGLGSFTVGTTNMALKPGGSSSPFSASGTFTLARTQTGSGPIVTTFQAINASFTWAGVTTTPLTIQSFKIASTGAFDAAINPVNLSLGGTGAMVLHIGTVSLHSSVLGLDVQLMFGGATLTIPNIISTANAITIPPFNVDTSGDFTATIASANQLTFGILTISGALVFQRVNGVFGLAVNRSTPTTLPQLTIPGLVNINLNVFVINSDGTFHATATTTQFRPSALSIRNASISVNKTGTALSTFGVSVTGGQLFLPIGSPVTLPTLTIQSDGTLNPNNVSISVPSLNFGSTFSVTSTTSFNLSLTAGVLDLKQSGSVAINVLANSSGMVLKNLEIASDGTFTGTVTGHLNPLGFQMASATLSISLSGGVVTMTLPASQAVNVNLGFVTARFSGFVRSNGQFSFTGTTTVSASVLGVGASGSATFTLGSSGFSGSFFGSFSALGVNLVNTSGSITQTGLLTVIVPTPLGPVPVSLQL